MIAVGVVGYIETPYGLRQLTTIWAQHLSEECRRRFIKNWYTSKKRAFVHACKQWSDPTGYKNIQGAFDRLTRSCSVIRVLAHTQVFYFFLYY